MTRGEIWTRAEVIDTRRLVTVAEITTSIRGLAAEVEVDDSDVGLARPSVISCDGIHTVAHRLDDDPEAYQCLGDASGSGGCGVEDEGPAISGLTFGGLEVRAWSWQFVPDDADAIGFKDHDGRTSWQRPQDRLVIFPDTVADDPDGDCACRLDAIDIEGAVIASVDVETLTYTSD